MPRWNVVNAKWKQSSRRWSDRATFHGTLRCWQVSGRLFYFCRCKTKTRSGTTTMLLGLSKSYANAPYLLCRWRVAINSRGFTAVEKRGGTPRILFTARSCYLVSFRGRGPSCRAEGCRGRLWKFDGGIVERRRLCDPADRGISSWIPNEPRMTNDAAPVTGDFDLFRVSCYVLDEQKRNSVNPGLDSSFLRTFHSRIYTESVFTRKMHNIYAYSRFFFLCFFY